MCFIIYDSVYTNNESPLVNVSYRGWLIVKTADQLLIRNISSQTGRANVKTEASLLYNKPALKKLNRCKPTAIE